MSKIDETAKALSEAEEHLATHVENDGPILAPVLRADLKTYGSALLAHHLAVEKAKIEKALETGKVQEDVIVDMKDKEGRRRTSKRILGMPWEIKQLELKRPEEEGEAEVKSGD